MASRKLIISSLLVAASSVLFGCAYGDESESDEIGTAASAVGPNGGNDISPEAIDAEPLKRSVTNSFGITSPTNADPRELCKPGTITSSGCVLKEEWESWLSADPTPRSWMMKGIAKCAVETGFNLRTGDGSKVFPGQWPLFTGWKTGRLQGQANRERVSSCILSLLNGNNDSLQICIIGPGGAPFSDACTNPGITTREGGFFGDLFAATPTAYVAGPDADEIMVNGRVCAATQGSYCCAENDTSCTHKIVRAGSITGSPDQNFANKRCNSMAMAGSFEYCTSYFSTREPGRNYTNVFTTFVPPAL